MPVLETLRKFNRMPVKYFFKSVFLIIYAYIPATFIGCAITSPLFLTLMEKEANNAKEFVLFSLSFGMAGVFFIWFCAIPAFFASLPIIIILLIKNNKNLLVWIAFSAILGATNAALLGVLVDSTKIIKITIGFNFIPTGIVIGGLMGFSMWQKVSKL